MHYSEEEAALAEALQKKTSTSRAQVFRDGLRALAEKLNVTVKAPRKR